MNTFFSKLLFVGCICAFVTTAQQVQASTTATLGLSGPRTTSVGQSIRIRAIISSEQSLNAIQGSLQYSKELLSVTNIAHGKSIIKYWQQEPNNDPGTGTISFTGGLPNPGFTGSSATVFEITAKARAEGTASIAFSENSQILANDGNGSVLSSTKQAITIQIIKAATPSQTPPPEQVDIPQDTTPPENLELLLGHDGNLFNGDWFAVFQATDADSGIDHYEIAEVSQKNNYPVDNEWIKATSPYRLQEQEQDTKVFFKAVDKAGNQSVTSHNHTVKPAILQIITTPTDWRFLIILVILLLFAVVLPIFVYHRKKQQADTVQK